MTPVAARALTSSVGGLILPEGATAGQTGPSKVMMTLAELESRTVDELQEMATELELQGTSRLKKQDLAFRILQVQSEQQGNILKKGILDVMDDGFGFMRVNTYLPSQGDVYVSQSQIRRFGLRPGDVINVSTGRNGARAAVLSFAHRAAGGEAWSKVGCVAS